MCHRDDYLSMLRGLTVRCYSLSLEGYVVNLALTYLLYRLGGLKGQEIGNMFDIDYSTVSVSRKRLRNRIQKDHDLKRLLSRIEAKLSKLKN